MGLLIDTSVIIDLGATALRCDYAVLTGNRREFQRIEGLRVISWPDE